MILADITTLYADSALAVDGAIAANVPSTVKIRTSSPGLALSGRNNIEVLEKKLTSDKYDLLRNQTAELAEKLYEALIEDEKFSSVAIVVIRALVTGSNPVSKAMCFEPHEIMDKSAIAVIDTGQPIFDALRNSPIRTLISNNSNVISVPINKNAFDFDFGLERAHPPFLERLKYSGWPRLGYRIWERLWAHIPDFLENGSVLVTRENPLLRETAYAMALKRFSITQLPSPPLTNTGMAAAPLELPDIVEQEIQQYVQRLVPPDICQPVVKMLLDRVHQALADYRVAEKHWINTLNKILAQKSGKKPIVVLANAPYRPSDVALFNLCRGRKILFAAFEHGVSKEIDNFHHVLNSVTEIATCDLFFSFNEKRSRISDQLKFAVGISCTVGMPREYHRGGNYRSARSGQPEIIYVSTTLFSENINATGCRGVSDTELAISEITLIEEVLGHLPHNVLYKPYPEHRYLDEDPILAAVDRQANIELHRQGLDLGYLLPDTKVIITARATSTMSWCLMTEKPVIYLNLKRQSPLRPDAREAFENAMFIFDDDDPDYISSLTTFLSQDISVIERKWQDMKAAREEAISIYIDSGGPGAGKRAARKIISELGIRLDGPGL
jgi:hypothetical protein